MNFKTFGEWLRHRRLKLDISPFKISEELGYKRVSAIYNFEYGVAPIPMPKWPAMARVLELSLEDFLSIMERFSPQKVTEFRAIQFAATAKSIDEHPLQSVSVLQARRDRSEVDELHAYRLEGAQFAVIMEGDSSNDFMSYIDELWSSGQKIGVVQLLSGRSFPAKEMVNAVKEVSTIGIFEWEMGPSTAAFTKAAFLDALTGAAGFPHIHRVPKIYTCLMGQSLQRVDPEHLKVLMEWLNRGMDSRIVRINRPSEISV